MPVDESLRLINGHLTCPTARVCVLLMSHCLVRDAHEILARVGKAPHPRARCSGQRDQ